MQPVVVYLTFQAIASLSPKDLARAANLLRPEDEDARVWLGADKNVLSASLPIEREDLAMAARAALEEFDSIILRAGLIGEVKDVIACREEVKLVVSGPHLQRLHGRCGQTYCDWCTGLLTSESIAASERLGLTNEFVWACDTCIVNGNYRQPPDGWGPPNSEWPFRDY